MCLGMKEKREWTVREYLYDQGLDLYKIRFYCGLWFITQLESDSLCRFRSYFSSYYL